MNQRKTGYNIMAPAGIDDEQTVDDKQPLDNIELGSLNRLIDDAPHHMDDSNQDPDVDKKRPRCFIYNKWVCCGCVWILGLSWKIKLAVTLFIAGFVIIAVLSADGNSCIYLPITIERLPDPTHLLPAGHAPPTAQAKHDREFILTLLGDSLIIDPEWKFGFNSKIRTFLGRYNDDALRLPVSPAHPCSPLLTPSPTPPHPTYHCYHHSLHPIPPPRRLQRQSIQPRPARRAHGRYPL